MGTYRDKAKDTLSVVHRITRASQGRTPFLLELGIRSALVFILHRGHALIFIFC